MSAEETAVDLMAKLEASVAQAKLKRDHPIPDDLVDKMAHALTGAPTGRPLMSDHPIPDDLVAIARRIHMTRFDDADLCDCADDELLDADTLAALAEWADGSLIAPNGWRRLDATEFGNGWQGQRWTGELLPWDTDEDGPAPPENCLYTLVERGES